jgi:hypothetical protein
MIFLYASWFVSTLSLIHLFFFSLNQKLTSSRTLMHLVLPLSLFFIFSARPFP